MSTSYATITASNMELTPCIVKFKAPGALTYTDLGGTLGNVTISPKWTKGEIKADQTADKVIDRVSSFVDCTVTTEIAEIKNKDIWSVIFPNATVVGTSPKAIQFNADMGVKDSALAGQLLLHPMSSGPTDVNYDWTFWKACSSSESQIIYSPKDQIKLKIVWNCYYDLSVTPYKLMTFGDSTL